jgi:hypothetical protein
MNDYICGGLLGIIIACGLAVAFDIEGEREEREAARMEQRAIEQLGDFTDTGVGCTDDCTAPAVECEEDCLSDEERNFLKFENGLVIGGNEK